MICSMYRSINLPVDGLISLILSCTLQIAYDEDGERLALSCKINDTARATEDDLQISIETYWCRYGLSPWAYPAVM
jgi:hypothetical protein